MLLHVDRNAGRTVPADDTVLATLAEIAAVQAGLARPEAAGSRIGGRRSRAG
jgi:hypothetical protein